MIDRRHLLRGGAALGLTVALPARARADDGRPGGDPFRIGALTPDHRRGPAVRGRHAGGDPARRRCGQSRGRCGRPAARGDRRGRPDRTGARRARRQEADRGRQGPGDRRHLGVERDARGHEADRRRVADRDEHLERARDLDPRPKDLVWRFQATTDQFVRAFAAVARQARLQPGRRPWPPASARRLQGRMGGDGRHGCRRGDPTSPTGRAIARSSSRCSRPSPT